MRKYNISIQRDRVWEVIQKPYNFIFNSGTRTKHNRFAVLVSVCFECGNDYQMVLGTMSSRENARWMYLRLVILKLNYTIRNLCNKRMCREVWVRFVDVFHFKLVKTACTSNDLVQISSQFSCIILIPKWCPRKNFLQTGNWHQPNICILTSTIQRTYLNRV